jgi:DNA-binding NarL/FixJ family response regulator
MPRKRGVSRPFPLQVSKDEDARVTSVRVGSERWIVLSVPLPQTRDVPLSEAELAVKEALLRGDSNAEIARARGTSVRTIANQVASIFKKLGVRSRAELAAQTSLTRKHETH